MLNGTHAHYFYPDTVGDRCQHCGKPEGERPHVALPSRWADILSHLPALGWQPVDITQYTRYHAQPLMGKNMVRVLLGTGHIERIGPPSRGRQAAYYRLTDRGLAWVASVVRPAPDASPPAVQGSP